MRKSTERTKQKESIGKKLAITFILTTGIIFITNMYMYYNISQSFHEIDQVYISNLSLSKIIDSLDSLHSTVFEYLSTKSSRSLEDYYRREEIYRSLVESNLQDNIVGDPNYITGKNIRNMSETYLSLIDESVSAKRGRNIVKYRENYENATKLYQYIKDHLNSLNDQLFKYNSIQYGNIQKTFRYLQYMSLTLLLFLTILNLLVVIMVTRSITDPLRKLTFIAYEVAEGKFNVNDELPQTDDEIGIVTKAFQRMMNSINEYIIQLKTSMELEKELREKEFLMANHLKDAQLKYLQAQINPHFLFNTLNAGAQLAMLEGADRTCTFIEHMSEFFRSNMNSFDRESTLRDEIKLVDSYIYILNVRFSGSIHFDKEVDESLLDYPVPGIILQPIVENAVNYGIREVEYAGHIKLKIYQKQEKIHVEIIDNGIGMEEDLIHRIMNMGIEEKDITSNYKHISKDSNGIGIRNVISRLKLYYQRDDVFEIESEGKNKGTTVRILLPISEKKKADDKEFE